MTRYIKYICYYNAHDSRVERTSDLAGTNKMDYIISVLNQLDYSVDLISLSICEEERMCVAPSKKIHWGPNTLRLFFSVGLHHSKLMRVFSQLAVRFQFFIWCIFNIKPGEEILVYHSLGYSKLLVALKKIFRCNFIGEIEEIYQDVTPVKKSQAKAEYDFIKSCSKYIFPTILLDKKLNTSHRPSIILHGIYQTVNLDSHSFDDGKIHVVYAGTFNPLKGGVYAAIESSKYLNSDYHLHILGQGTKETIELVKQKIAEVSPLSSAKITYDGLLVGEAFSRFLHQCHIGLSTQNPSASFNDTSYPSKILTYMANGLQVVSIKIPVVETSAVSSMICYYTEQTPENLAEAITCVDINNPKDVKGLLKKLDNEFKVELSKLLTDTNCK